MSRILLIVFAVSYSVAMIGCGSSPPTEINSKALTPVSIDSSKYVLADEPDGAIGVIAARQSTADGEPVIVVGRVGGAANPWIEGRAAFMLLDPSMTLVASGTESSGGEICMDECCAAERTASTTLVKVVDESGKVLTADARQLFGLALNDMVVVSGKASKDASGNFAVLANGVHVRQ